jgi:Resolvase, N terminal domain
MTRAVIYCRVSTTTGQSVEMQLRDLRQLAGQRGFEIVGEYCDEGVSGVINWPRTWTCDSVRLLDSAGADLASATLRSSFQRFEQCEHRMSCRLWHVHPLRNGSSRRRSAF